MSKEPARPTFEELATPEVPALFRFLCWSVGNRADAEDALQEVLVRAYRSLDSLREKEKFHSWIFKIAANVGRTVKTKRRRGAQTYGLAPYDDAAALALGRGEATPFEAIQQADADERLARALAALPSELREPLLLHTMSGMKYREVAETLGWPIGTVTTRIHVAREKLARLLERS